MKLERKDLKIIGFDIAFYLLLIAGLFVIPMLIAGPYMDPSKLTFTEDNAFDFLASVSIRALLVLLIVPLYYLLISSFFKGKIWSLLSNKVFGWKEFKGIFMILFVWCIPSIFILFISVFLFRQFLVYAIAPILIILYHYRSYILITYLKQKKPNVIRGLIDGIKIATGELSRSFIRYALIFLAILPFNILYRYTKNNWTLGLFLIVLFAGLVYSRYTTKR